jgi:hypothetical protein
MVLIPDRRFRLAVSAGGNFQRRLDPMSKLTRLEKYHLNYVSQRQVSKVVAVTPAAMEVEKRAVERESKGQYRIAARLWLLCMDAAVGEVERARIAIRRDRCISKGNGLRRGEYAGIGCRGVVYD